MSAEWVPWSPWAGGSLPMLQMSDGASEGALSRVELDPVWVCIPRYDLCFGAQGLGNGTGPQICAGICAHAAECEGRCPETQGRDASASTRCPEPGPTWRAGS